MHAQQKATTVKYFNGSFHRQFKGGETLPYVSLPVIMSEQFNVYGYFITDFLNNNRIMSENSMFMDTS